VTAAAKREVAIAAAKAAVAAHTGHTAKLFQSALSVMQSAHQLAAASEDGEEISGQSKQHLSAAEAEELVRRTVSRSYAELESVGQRRGKP
jgi:hypothetical protein